MLQTLILQRKSCAALIKWPQLVKQSPSFWFDFLETQHWLFYASTDTHCILDSEVKILDYGLQKSLKHVAMCAFC